VLSPNDHLQDWPAEFLVLAASYFWVTLHLFGGRDPSRKERAQDDKALFDL